MLALVSIFICAAIAAPAAREPALKHSDVAFMYQASPEVYRQYGATVLAWGSTPNPAALAAAKGVRFFGSVGMVTEFAQYYERFPATYEQALCRDIDGKPVKVPWLTDHSHKGIQYWWCCTQQPQFRQYLRERVQQVVRAGAYGLHVDDHLGTSGGLWLGICFCDRCMEGFRGYLKQLPPAELGRLGIGDPATYDFRAAVKAWLAEDASRKRQVSQHPLWPAFAAYQGRAAAAFMLELRQLAAETAGHPVPVGANAGLLWPRHLADYKALDLFVAETDHQAETRRMSDMPLVAYRLAEAVDRPYAATASGQDWAFIKEKNLPGLVRGWIALSYAAGQRLMAPHHQWCYTPEKGTHWYDGPNERFAPLYQFVRQNAALFDGYDTYADVGVVMPHASFVKNTGLWTGLGNRLAAANVSYRLLLAGDDIVDHPLPAADLSRSKIVLVTNQQDLLPADRRLVEARCRKPGAHTSVQDALAAIQPAVRVSADGPVRALPRVKKGSAVVHLVNYAYDAERDDVRPLSNVEVTVDLGALGVSKAKECRLVAPGAEPVTLTVTNGVVRVPTLGVWALLVFDAASHR